MFGFVYGLTRSKFGRMKMVNWWKWMDDFNYQLWIIACIRFCGVKTENRWPIPRFHFQVDGANQKILDNKHVQRPNADPPTHVDSKHWFHSTPSRKLQRMHVFSATGNENKYFVSIYISSWIEKNLLISILGFIPFWIKMNLVISILVSECI